MSTGKQRMEQLQVPQRMKGVLLLWMVLCCLVTVVSSGRVMWVDTQGKDSPQCIHDTPVSALMTQPPPSKSCLSLQYALQNALNSTSIKITCGTHELQPYLMPPDGSSIVPSGTFALQIVSECNASRPIIQCQNGSNLTFSNVADVMIRGVVVQGPMLFDDFPTLYFSNCTYVKLEDVTVYVPGQYGTGILFKGIASRGVITLSNISILHNGTYGAGIRCNIHGSNQSEADYFSLYMNNTQVINTDTHSEYDPSMYFQGIGIIIHGTGSAAKVSLHNITVFNSAPVSGSGIFVGLLGAMHQNNVTLSGVTVLDGWDERYIHTKSRDEVLADCAKRQNESIKGNAMHKVYVSVAVQVNTSYNEINISDVQIVASYGPDVVGLGVTIQSLSMFNKVLLKDVSLSARGNALVDRTSLLVNFSGIAYANSMVLQDLLVVNSTTSFGVGALLAYSGWCTRNNVLVVRGTFSNHVAKEGGTLKLVFTDYARNNNIFFSKTVVENNTAMVGGGIQIILSGFAIGNGVFFQHAMVAGNKAHAGGGIFIKFSDKSQRNIVSLFDINIANNTLTQSANDISMLGGGIFVIFLTDKATFATNNRVIVNHTFLIDNKAKGGVGGGLSVLYVHSLYTGDSEDKVHLDYALFVNNQADYGQAFAMQSAPKHRKRLFRGIISTNTTCLNANRTAVKDYDQITTVFKQFLNGTVNASWLDYFYNHMFTDKVIHLVKNLVSELNMQVNPFFQIQTSTNMIFLVSVQIRMEGRFTCACSASSQGILATDSEIILQPGSSAYVFYCVASHGGGMALFGESYIRFLPYSGLILNKNYAFQRGGALYVHSAQHAVPHVHCFLQQVQGSTVGVLFIENSAKHEGQSLYISEAESCFNNDTLQTLIFYFAHLQESLNITELYFEETQWWRTGQTCIVDGIIHSSCTDKDNTSQAIARQIASRPDHLDGAPVDLDSPLCIQFIPGKQKKLPYRYAYDKLGNRVDTVFTVQINYNIQENTSIIQLNPFSKYTADFTVILHGIPLRHGMANHLSSTANVSNATGNATPQLVLQSVDNNNLLLVVNIEIQCCPPGYIYQKDHIDMGTCYCGMTQVVGIAECNETDPNQISAVLQTDHWVGYLPSSDQHSCDGQKLFSANCPPGYCQTQQTTLPTNNSRRALEEIVCGKSNRKGLLCGDCLEGNSIAVNFNGIRPVCINCQDGLSTVGLLVWVISEWVPMLLVMFIVMLFNVDLVSGRFNSFLLFAQLLAFSSIRGDVELGPVHIAFVKIYRFLYGMWNLDFVGVLLPPYCLIPQAHFTLLHTLMLYYSIGLFPLTVAITLTALERSAEKWICCHRVDQCLRWMRRWKAKYSDGMSYDRALPAFIILGFTRFLVSSFYILVNQTITGEDGEERMVVWWQGSVPYGSIQHIAYFIPAIAILTLFVLLPAFLLLMLPIVPQLFGRLIIAVPALRKLQRIQSCCSNIYTDRWVYHFVNVFQGCYKERFRSFSSLYLFHRIVQLLAAVFIPRAEDALRVQLILTLALLLLVTIIQPYNISHLNTLDTAILGNLSLVLALNLQITDKDTPIEAKQFLASVQMILTYLPLLYPAITFGRKVYLKCTKLRCFQRKDENAEDDVESQLEDPAEGLGNLVRITELRAGVPTSSDEETETETQEEEELLGHD